MPFKQGQSGNSATMFKPGQSGNPKGKRPGLKSWSTLVKQVLEDGELLEKLLKHGKGIPKWFEEIEDKRMGNMIILAMGMKAMAGDSKAATWLRKTGYGDKLDITSGDQPIKPIQVLDMSPPKPKRPAKKVIKKGKRAGNKPQAKRSLRAGSKPKSPKA